MILIGCQCFYHSSNRSESDPKDNVCHCHGRCSCRVDSAVHLSWNDFSNCLCIVIFMVIVLGVDDREEFSRRSSERHKHMKPEAHKCLFTKWCSAWIWWPEYPENISERERQIICSQCKKYCLQFFSLLFLWSDLLSYLSATNLYYFDSAL